ncbi:hypothetical protein C2G38_2070506 [Gigaspora rosea]|uniref:Uncharacterized protein n=1 Tax=Gigaspora rosea TaxID=44941 RepID=A0A397VNW6_9GLOM|nr:hypothetical protein C2G38_2070506 [Gigaspora rosea]
MFVFVMLFHTLHAPMPPTLHNIRLPNFLFFTLLVCFIFYSMTFNFFDFLCFKVYWLYMRSWLRFFLDLSSEKT